MRITKRKLLYFVILPNLLVFTFLASYFPGAQLPIALTLASGIYRGALQECIDACEAKAIRGADFTEEEIEFLEDLYTSLYKGARLTLVLSEVSKMMEHYLSGSGEPLGIDASIFNTNDKVTHEMEQIRAQIRANPQASNGYRSAEFYMPDFSNIDSVFGLYYGHVEAASEITGDEIRIRWRAEVPWEWPSYESLKEKHGDYHAESFPIPNASCLVRGFDGAVFIDNGLGEYLTRLGIAKSFLAYAEWEETLKRR